VFAELVCLRGYDGQVRQISVIDLGHEEPTVLLTNDRRSRCPTLVTRYAQRMLVANRIAEAIPWFRLDALLSLVGLQVDFDR
jgi:hypothetical protein